MTKKAIIGRISVAMEATTLRSSKEFHKLYLLPA